MAKCVFSFGYLAWKKGADQNPIENPPKNLRVDAIM
jgi:hypothetical protein